MGNVGFMGLEDRDSFYGGGELNEEGGIFRRRVENCRADGFFCWHFVELKINL